MLNKKHFGRIINVFLCFFLSIALSIVALVYTNELTFTGLVLSFISSFAISYFIADITNVGELGMRFAKAVKLKEHSLPFTLVNTAIVCIIMVTLTSFFSTILSVGFQPILMMAWISIYPYWMLVGYICLLILTPLAERLAGALTKSAN
jgi:membrane protease YdiL (CAAX protease family)